MVEGTFGSLHQSVVPPASESLDDQAKGTATGRGSLILRQIFRLQLLISRCSYQIKQSTAPWGETTCYNLPVLVWSQRSVWPSQGLSVQDPSARWSGSPQFRRHAQVHGACDRHKKISLPFVIWVCLKIGKPQNAGLPFAFLSTQNVGAQKTNPFVSPDQPVHSLSRRLGSDDDPSDPLGCFLAHGGLYAVAAWHQELSGN